MIQADLLPHLCVDAAGSRLQTQFADFEGRVFGGEVLAKAVTAAASSAPGRTLHSLHGHFLRAVRPLEAAELKVSNLSEGRRLAARRVELLQSGKLLAEFTLSFTSVNTGYDYEHTELQLARAMPDQLATREHEHDGPEPFDWRDVEPAQPEGATAPGSGRWTAWVRLYQPLPDEIGLHAAAYAYLSDYGSLRAVQLSLGAKFDWSGSTSLDHSFWLHRPLPWNDWVYLEARNDLGVANRGFTSLHIYSRRGQRIATMAQESIFAVQPS